MTVGAVPVGHCARLVLSQIERARKPKTQKGFSADWALDLWLRAHVAVGYRGRIHDKRCGARGTKVRQAGPESSRAVVPGTEVNEASIDR